MRNCGDDKEMEKAQLMVYVLPSYAGTLLGMHTYIYTYIHTFIRIYANRETLYKYFYSETESEDMIPIFNNTENEVFNL